MAMDSMIAEIEMDFEAEGGTSVLSPPCQVPQ